MGVETMVAMTLVQGAMKYQQGKSNADSIRNQNAMNQEMAQFQKEQMEIQQQEVIEQGDNEASLRQKQLRQMLGSQRVGFAGQGIELEGELGSLLERDAREAAKGDVKAIKNNAWKRSMGIEMDQMDLELDTRFKTVQSEAKAYDQEVQGTMGLVNSAVSAYGINKQYGTKK